MEWIKVCDQMPPMHKTLIVYCHEQGGYSENIHYVDVKFFGGCDDDIDKVGLWYGMSDHIKPLAFAYVSHWMPLPEAPKKEGTMNSEPKPKGYGQCPDCVWFNQPEGCNVERDSEVCLRNKKLDNREETK